VSKRSSSDYSSAAELRALYAKADAALDGWGCGASTDCCRFGVTGREPYPTAIELAELDRAVRARGGLPKGQKRGSLPIAAERRCVLLTEDGRCFVYASRPFGCRTFFCERAEGPVGERAPGQLPTATLREIGRDIASLSARFAPTDPGPRPLSNATQDWQGRQPRTRR
jgi:Fe-S-cluster containining protein